MGKQNEASLQVKQAGILVAIQQALKAGTAMFASLLKILLLSRPVKPLDRVGGKAEVVILANGPSAKEFLETGTGFLAGKDLLTVNYSVLSPFFAELRPSFHVVADPVVFADDKMATLFDHLVQKTEWPLTLFLPRYAKKYPLWDPVSRKLQSNPRIRVRLYNMTRIDGPLGFLERAVMKGWGLPAPRNVLVPAIAHCIRMGFSKIYLVGVDHSWIKLLWVNDQNEVMIDDKHFYDASAGPASAVHRSAPLYKTLESIALVLQSYQVLDRIAQKRGIHVYNTTPGSYIDVFDRMKI